MSLLLGALRVAQLHHRLLDPPVDQHLRRRTGIDRVLDIRSGAGTVGISGVTVFNGNANGTEVESITTTPT